MAGRTIVNSTFLHHITEAEKAITNQVDPVAGGPTANAQRHAGQQLTSQVVHDITMGEKKITGQDDPMKNGPTAIAQHFLTSSDVSGQSQQPSAILDSATIAKITEKENEITGQDDSVRRGPTARAQQHAGEQIMSRVLHDITEGEKKITGGQRVKGGPTSTAQSELARSRS